MNIEVLRLSLYPNPKPQTPNPTQVFFVIDRFLWKFVITVYCWIFCCEQKYSSRTNSSSIKIIAIEPLNAISAKLIFSHSFFPKVCSSLQKLQGHNFYSSHLFLNELFHIYLSHIYFYWFCIHCFLCPMMTGYTAPSSCMSLPAYMVLLCLRFVHISGRYTGKWGEENIPREDNSSWCHSGMSEAAVATQCLLICVTILFK